MKSLSRDPAWNLSLERELVQWDDDFLLFYINSPSVIVGRNQCIEAEADVAWCAARGIPVLRRVSGGGAVWHDEGNINFSFISDKNTFSPLDDASRLLESIVEALADLGIKAEVGPRRELTAGGFKISGTASYQRGGRRIFHGTLLYNADLETMDRALSGNPSLRGRKTASVPSKVANLNTLLGTDISTDEFLDRLIGFFVRRSCGKNESRK